MHSRLIYLVFVLRGTHFAAFRTIMPGYRAGRAHDLRRAGGLVRERGLFAP
jgi:hypothetical protein